MCTSFELQCPTQKLMERDLSLPMTNGVICSLQSIYQIFWYAKRMVQGLASLKGALLRSYDIKATLFMPQ